MQKPESNGYIPSGRQIIIDAKNISLFLILVQRDVFTYTTVPTIRVYLMPRKQAKQAAAKNACEGKWTNLYHHWDYHWN